MTLFFGLSWLPLSFYNVSRTQGTQSAQMLLLSRIRRLTHISSVSCRTSPFLYRNFSKTNSRFELKMNHVSTQEALKLRTQDSLNLLHVDVRNISELEQDGFIPKTVSVPLPTLSAYHLPVDKQQPILFSCRAGGRSAKAAQQAVDWGHERGAIWENGNLGKFWDAGLKSCLIFSLHDGRRI